MSLTDLDGIEIGALVWSATRGTVAGQRHGGMVVDVGLHDDGSPYAVILKEVPPHEVRIDVRYRNAKTTKSPHVARLDRIDLSDVAPDDIEEPKVSRMQGWAKKALWGECALPGETFALALAAATLYQEAKRFAAEERERRAS